MKKGTGSGDIKYQILVDPPRVNSIGHPVKYVSVKIKLGLGHLGSL
jgi:hypothetical protein